MIGSCPPEVLDVFRWVSIVWLFFAMGWIVQIAVISWMSSVTYLASGLILAMFIDVGDQFERLGLSTISYRLPITYIELILITIGMSHFVKLSPGVHWVKPFFFLLRFGRKRSWSERWEDR